MAKAPSLRICPGGAKFDTFLVHYILKYIVTLRSIPGPPATPLATKKMGTSNFILGFNYGIFFPTLPTKYIMTGSDAYSSCLDPLQRCPKHGFWFREVLENGENHFPIRDGHTENNTIMREFSVLRRNSQLLAHQKR